MVPEDAAIPPDNRTPAQLAESVTKGRELFYGAKANCVKCHGPTALGRRPAGRLRRLEQSDSRIHQGDGRQGRPRSVRCKEELDEAKGDDVQKVKDQLIAAKKELQRAARGDRDAVAAAACDSAQPARRRLPRRSPAARFVLADFGRYSRHADAGDRPGRAGRAGHADSARNLADCRLRSVAAVRAGQPAAEAAD